MTGRVFVIGGPNLGRLGRRQPEIYGDTTWSELESLCLGWSGELGLELEFLQSDVEGELVGMIHNAGDDGDGIILNAAAYTHTSVAIRDAVAAVDIPVVELHLTNPDARETFRRENLLTDVVTAGIRGFGIGGYRLALVGISAMLKAGQNSIG
ncbi:MAG: 3-dehydroquinate dehydratase [Candidatus Krumholzibacteria bacterium]|nr:3-dehydroquinate dehydratase [Candidatus Krumholzibacteria bacterium]